MDEKHIQAKAYQIKPFENSNSNPTQITDRNLAKEMALQEHRERHSTDNVHNEQTHTQPTEVLSEDARSELFLAIQTLQNTLENLSIKITENASKIQETISDSLLSEIKNSNELLLGIADLQKKQLSDTPSNDSIIKLSETISELNKNTSYFSDKIDLVKKESLEYCRKIIPKIISREVSSHSELIIESGFNLVFSEIKNATKITLHLNKIDYALLNDKIAYIVNSHNPETVLKIESSETISRGDFLFLSDQGNFDINLSQKTKLVLDSIIN